MASPENVSYEQRVEYIDEQGRPVAAPPTGAGTSGFSSPPLGGNAAPFAARATGTGSAAPATQLLAPVWRTGIATGVVTFLIGLAMIAATNGIAAVIFWPLGAFTMVAGGSVFWATVGARRATERLAHGLENRVSDAQQLYEDRLR